LSERTTLRPKQSIFIDHNRDQAARTKNIFLTHDDSVKPDERFWRALILLCAERMRSDEDKKGMVVIDHCDLTVRSNTIPPHSGENMAAAFEG